MKKQPYEQRVKRRVVYQGKILDLYVDQVRIPDGSRHVREVVGHCPAVAVVPLLGDGRVVLVRQYRYAINRVLWEIPAGLVDPRESLRQAVLRELREETGFRARSLQKMVSIFSSPGFSQEKIHLYLAQDLLKVADLSLDTDEFITVKIIPLQKALHLIAQGKITDGKSVL